MSKHPKTARPVGHKEERDGSWGPLAGAALALERDIRRCEELTAAARKVPLDTRKGIERAAKATTEAAAAQERVPLSLGALVQAIHVARERQEANAAALLSRGEELRLRIDQIGVLYERHAALGEEASLINQLVQDVAGRQRDATTPERARELAAAIDGVDDRMSKLVEAARALGQAAAAAELTDLTEQAESLRQQVAATRNKVGLLGKSLHARAPIA